MGFDGRRGLRAFESALDRIESIFDRPTEFTREPFVSWLAETERRQFASQGGAGKGGRWQRLAPSTLRGKAAAGRSLRFLESTGATRELLTRAESRSGLIQVSGDRVVFRLPEPAAFHQRGGPRLPRREVYASSEGQRQDLKGRVKQAAVGRMRQDGINVKG